MKFPILIRKGNVLVVAPEDFFEPIGRLDHVNGLLDINVTSDGKAHLYWILDCEGNFTELTSLGTLQSGLFEALRLRRRRERYQLGSPRMISARELLRLVESLADQHVETPHASDLRAHLQALEPDEIVDQSKLQGYFGPFS